MDYTYGRKRAKRIGSRKNTLDWLRPERIEEKKKEILYHKEQADLYARHSEMAYIKPEDRQFQLSVLGLDGWTIDPLSTEETSVLYKDGQYVITSRGTSNLKDVGTDADLVKGNLRETQRYKDYKGIVEEIQGRDDGDVILSGHSLGGSIAHNTAVELGISSYTFNRGSDVGELFTEDESTELQVSYRTEGDLVSVAITPTVTFENKDGYSAHSLENFYE